jgi:hypothetical protein
MIPSEQNTPEAYQSRRGGRFELFFYEQVGTRYYLRFTRLALVLIVCLTIVPIVAIFAFFYTRRHADLENVNVNITVPPRASGNYGGPIIQPPANMPTPPKVGRTPRVSNPARQIPAAPGLNVNTPPTPSPTPLSPPPRPSG